ncbi:MAG: hypothetical protein OEZ34_16240 [Spirochaetia bacterium]|nr:hypothetical protein [Spirochaetia bacterium]
MKTSFFKLKKRRFLLIFSVIFISNCSVFQFKSHHSFSDWYFGKPGIDNAFKGRFHTNKNCYEQSERRHPFYLHFRLFEVILNPQGGTKYPDYLGKCYPEAVTPEKIEKLYMGYNMGGAGLIDALIPYRYVSYINSRNDSNVTHYILIPFVSLVSLVPNLLINIIKIPLYAIHDTIKLLSVPFAVIYYYAVQEENSS